MDTAGRLPLRDVVPVTDWKPQYAGYTWFTFIAATARSGLSKDSGADTFQVKSVSQIVLVVMGEAFASATPALDPLFINLPVIPAQTL